MNSDPIGHSTTDRNRRSSPLIQALVTASVLGLLNGGCGQPSETTRDNRRLMDAILTAVTIRNNTELGKDKKLLDARKESGQLSAEAYDAIRKIIAQAEAGDWTTAERHLYEFRERVPFPE